MLFPSTESGRDPWSASPGAMVVVALPPPLLLPPELLLPPATPGPLAFPGPGGPGWVPAGSLPETG